MGEWQSIETLHFPREGFRYVVSAPRIEEPLFLKYAFDDSSARYVWLDDEGYHYDPDMWFEIPMPPRKAIL